MVLILNRQCKSAFIQTICDLLIFIPELFIFLLLWNPVGICSKKQNLILVLNDLTNFFDSSIQSIILSILQFQKIALSKLNFTLFEFKNVACE